MTIDWQHFTWFHALLGGVLIGSAVAAFMLLSGRVAGISGILGGLLRWQAHDRAWRLAFLAGLVFAPLLYAAIWQLPEIVIDASYPLLLIAGVLVGFGTRLGSGCTSGHGICGVSRGALRSWVATGVFIAVGIVTVYLLRHVLGGVV
ncbi:YeeE/YedE [Pseudomonas alkylphenolica]|uniref:YeeE/YedE n=1 Tax=Pseudomonas alkylphenolica TaxID=237609 RepID=A0A443ZRT1_9PSED|nr:YeeE/YedE family protein [Pseudomonas alkylphenolica]RWU21901.1 YeeE/YedE [Pseudomonas alkylphenolica]